MANFNTKSGADQGAKPAARRPALLAWAWVWLALAVLGSASWLSWWQEPAPVSAGYGPIASSFWKPVEVNPHRRLTAVPDVALTSVNFHSDGRRGWVVGDRGLILATVDGGKTWAAQTSNSTASLKAVSFHSDGQRGWAVGAGGLLSGDGVILATVDGGKTWAAQTSNAKASLNAVSFHSDGQRGWAVGDSRVLSSGDGVILATVDGGKTWAAQTSNAKASLLAVSFHSDGQQGWVVGDLGTILATVDGGKSWVAQLSNSVARLWSISFHSDGQRGWAMGGNPQISDFDGVILATTDGGKTWMAQTSNSIASLFAASFHSDGQRGWAVGSGGAIRATVDGGKTWAAQTSNSKASLSAVSFHSDGQRGWAVGWGTILATGDGGKTWAAQTSNSKESLSAVSFHSDGQRGWAVGGVSSFFSSEGFILATIDGGKTWASQVSNWKASLRAVSFHSDGQRGWAVGGGTFFSASDGVILATVDGGKTWAAQTSNSNASLGAVSFHSDGRRGWAVGRDGTILATVDGGKTWAAQTSNSKASLSAVSFHSDGQRGWAVGGGSILSSDDGVILATVDGGKTWAAQTSNSNASLNAVSFLSDGQQGWAVGAGGLSSSEFGVILATVDGGKTWAAQTSNSKESLNAVSFHSDGQQGWAVGQGGTILATVDGGKTWAAQTSNSTASLHAVSFHSDGQQGWAVGRGGTMLSTIDGGKTWGYAEPYSRYPAPWYWVAVVLAAGLAWLSWKLRPQGIAGELVADVAASDAEVRSAADDRLEFGGLARGISRFLRNDQTRPPLTLAITGDWGSGKSSLMRLVCADMVHFGHRPVWFNAWHHQKQEHLFAALLGAVRAQAVPNLFSVAGVLFRLRLLWLRSRNHFVMTALLLLAVATLTGLGMNAKGGVLLHQLTTVLSAAKPAAEKPDEATKRATSPAGMPVAADATASEATPWEGLPMVGEGLAALAAALTVAVTLIKGSKPFGVDPALLLAGVREDMSLKTAAAQNDFRAQFAQQFGELVQALPGRLMIVIDDLDRCRADAVLEVMESVNYLTSAGECFVMFGMATERVQAALGLAFKDIAGEMLQMEKHQGEIVLAEGAASPDAALIKRRDYAADYLQKLVNIEIKVPSRQDAQTHLLLVPPEPAPRHTVLNVLSGLWRLWPLVIMVLAVCVGWWLSDVLGRMEHPPVVRAEPVAVTVSVGTVTVGPVGPVKPPPEQWAVVDPIPSSALVVQPGASASVASVIGWLGVALLPMLVVGLVILLRLLRSTIQETRDSHQFRQALEIWTDVVASKRGTPRAIKRFGNRIRYLAMLQQGEDKDETRLDLLKGLARKLWSRNPASSKAAVPSRPNALAEHQLIALGAWQEIRGDVFNQPAALTLDAMDWTRFLDEQVPSEQMQHRVLRQAVKAHEEKFNTQWPPSLAEIEVFQRLTAGVRLAGDPEVLPPLAARKDESSSSRK